MHIDSNINNKTILPFLNVSIDMNYARNGQKVDAVLVFLSNPSRTEEKKHHKKKKKTYKNPDAFFRFCHEARYSQ